MSVSFTTGNGTAMAGSDYTATNGTLNWLNGETGAKTFTVLGDATLEPDETVNVTLTLPTGGANLGSPAASLLTITNDDTVSAARSLQFLASSLTGGATLGTPASATLTIMLDETASAPPAPSGLSASSTILITVAGQRYYRVRVP